MKLRDLTPDPSWIWPAQVSPDLEIASITSDSRQVGPGTLFVAVTGTAQDGHEFIDAAFSAGAALVIGEKPRPASGSGPYLLVADSRLVLARLASRFHGDPSTSMLMIGVTGTSGKTTTTYLIESILRAAGREVGVIGTVNFRHGEKIYPSTHTTPGPVELQKLLAEMKAGGCDAVVMEVSSHALKQRRTASVHFDGMVFTNLSREHLDFHPDMEDYFQSKALLFTEYAAESARAGKKPFAAVNTDDEYGKKLLSLLDAKRIPGLRVGSYGLADSPDFSGASLSMDMKGIRGDVAGVAIDSPLMGRFNAYNVIAAVAVTRGLGLGEAQVSRGLRDLRAVPGRLEKVEDPSGGVHVLVDYAHKPDALEKVLKCLQEVQGKSKLITVVGCGGDRDRTKRPVMGRLAVELSTHAFITSDNPRTEDPRAIIAEVVEGTKGHANLTVEPDRRKAIHAAIALAHAGDIVLIAGKGHEDYQIIGKTKIHFDDREVAAEALARPR